tara:strand:+ start:1307 stop:1525 length:219 start_codon:yes stop_codon:yes gene_type:complete
MAEPKCINRSRYIIKMGRRQIINWAESVDGWADLMLAGIGALAVLALVLALVTLAKVWILANWVLDWLALAD